MKQSPLPEIMLGSWIWANDNLDATHVQHALFRRDFILDTTPATTEIQVCAKCAYQLFVNGRFFTLGPTSHPLGNDYVAKIDVSPLMQLGANSIGIHAFCDGKPVTSRTPDMPGFWLQVVCDNIPVLWTDNKWLVYPLDAYAQTDLVVSPAESTVEILDYNRIPQSWLLLTQKHFSADENQLNEAVEWKKVTSTWPLKSIPLQLETETLHHHFYEPRAPEKILSRAVVTQKNAYVALDFTPAFNLKKTPGFYAGETFLYVPKESTQIVYCFSTALFKLLVNDKIVAQPRCPEKRHRYSMPPSPKKCDTKLDNTQFDVEVQFKEGWNKITVVKWCDEPHGPFSIIFDDLAHNTVSFRRAPDANAQLGWSIAGPVRTPVQLISDNFSIETLPKYPFHDKENPQFLDSAAISMAYVTQNDATMPLDAQMPIPLTQSQTIVFDFGRTIFSIPEIRLTGQQGDIIDVTVGEHVIGNEVVALENGIRRNTSTIVLSDTTRPIIWLLKENKGFRYLMLTVRTAKTAITLHRVTAFVSSTYTQGHGTFECDDDTLNAVWKAGVETLNATYQKIFLDSPTKDQTQCLPDTMIQACSAFYTHAAYRQAGEALEAFARTQLEIGEINALTPSSFFQSIPDFSLLWPVWLQKHILHTGDKHLALKLFPTLLALMDYYNTQATEDDGPIADAAEVLGNHPFIDVEPLNTNGISTALNAIYCRALFAAAWVAEFLEDTDLKAIFVKRASKIARLVHHLTWDPDQQLFADAYVDGELSPFSSWQANVLAIYGGIATPEETEAIWKQLFSTEQPYELFSQGEYNNPYFKYFILDCAFANGYAGWGLDLIRYYWGNMLKDGATTWWELYDPENPALLDRICSHCHGYAVSPNAFLISEVAGIRPAEPGMNVVFFNPDLKNIKWCRSSIPTPLGPINLAWELRVNDVLEITISSNHPLDVIPVLSPNFAEKAVFNVSENVSIMVEDDSQPDPDNTNTLT